MPASPLPPPATRQVVIRELLVQVALRVPPELVPRPELVLAVSTPTSLTLALLCFSGCKRKRAWNGARKYLPEAKIMFSTEETVFFFSYWRGGGGGHMCICPRFSFDISLCIGETVKLNKMWLFCGLYEALVLFVFKE